MITSALTSTARATSRSKRVRLISATAVLLHAAPGEAPGPSQDVVACLLDPIILWCGWRGRIRTFDLLIQSQAPDSGLASQRVSVKDSDLCPIPG